MRPQALSSLKLLRYMTLLRFGTSPSMILAMGAQDLSLPYNLLYRR